MHTRPLILYLGCVGREISDSLSDDCGTDSLPPIFACNVMIKSHLTLPFGGTIGIEYKNASRHSKQQHPAPRPKLASRIQSC